ncbi:MAG: class I SAM-dependent methyltransferase [Candidatus Heimdallarchaeota archaeon]|nr:class I SAM-dependent methyltransferase [Candidatus Heimdallarchaeota archaeon]MCK4290933.1 class I SAM-dependent methyltransferase [Candidatus Heimdallarchaeota archaeon]
MTDENNSETKNRFSIPEVYDLIAESFDSKRRHPWKEVIQFIKQLPATSRILDLGCGNARHTRVMLERNFEVIGLDISYRILQTAKENELSSVKDKLTSLINSDARVLPFRNEVFDHVIMIAVIHHFESIDDRVKILQEIKRILTENGTCLISTWLKTHPRFQKEDLSELVKSGKQDILVPWTLANGKKINRYYYLFEKEELEELVLQLGFKILNSEISNHNLFLSVKKT